MYDVNTFALETEIVLNVKGSLQIPWRLQFLRGGGGCVQSLVNLWMVILCFQAVCFSDMSVNIYTGLRGVGFQKYKIFIQAMYW